MHAAGVRNGDELVNFPSRVSLAAAIEKLLPRDSGDGDVVMAPRGGGGAPIEESSTIELVFRRASAVPFGIGWRARGPTSSRAVPFDLWSNALLGSRCHHHEIRSRDGAITAAISLAREQLRVRLSSESTGGSWDAYYVPPTPTLATARDAATAKRIPLVNANKKDRTKVQLQTVIGESCKDAITAMGSDTGAKVVGTGDMEGVRRNGMSDAVVDAQLKFHSLSCDATTPPKERRAKLATRLDDLKQVRAATG